MQETRFLHDVYLNDVLYLVVLQNIFCCLTNLACVSNLLWQLTLIVRLCGRQCQSKHQQTILLVVLARFVILPIAIHQSLEKKLPRRGALGWICSQDRNRLV
ncbi:hypothetical protein BKA63DRAFT_138685 [Paraphoma chrysanthemicola]|nr:hypothetical protein BKA63DRAFT_138685 [Paraphoma chrysanthemicola]